MSLSNPFPEQTTERLRLRRFEDADLDHVFLGLSHPEVIRYYGVSYASREATRTQMSWFAQLEKEETGIWWAITLKEADTFLGGVGFNDWNKTDRRAEIGFWLLPEYWRKGLAAEAIRAACRFGFSGLNLHRIEAEAETENRGSRRVLERVGFHYEGTLRECEWKNGVFVSLDQFGLLEGELDQ